MQSPLISVVMPVYNGGSFLKEAVESILCQTFQEFEFIIINDGSTDGSGDLLEHYAHADQRIRLIHQHNQGLPLTRNRGIGLTRGRYIANMDADDISLPNRLEKQLLFMEANTNIAALGTQIATVDQNGDQTGKNWLPPSCPGLVAWRTLFRPSIAHSTVMIKRSVIAEVKGYDPACRVGEDFELWTRLVPYHRLQSLPEILYNRRIWGGNITSTKSIEDEIPLVKSLTKLHAHYIEPVASARDLLFFRNFVYYGTKKSAQISQFSVSDLQRVFYYIKRLRKAFIEKHPYAHEDKIIIIRDEHKKLMDISYGVDQFNRLIGLALKLRTPLLISQINSFFRQKMLKL